jgi:hypothetical protein
MLVELTTSQWLVPAMLGCQPVEDTAALRTYFCWLTQASSY